MTRRRRASPGRTEILEVEVTALGFEGDGVAESGGERLIVPLALPGERWRVRRTGRGRVVAPEDRITSAADRATPVCPHFGTCGGCALQHLPSATYDAVKIGRIEGALRARGLTPPESIPLHKSPLDSRRRIRLGYSADGRLGFRRRAGRGLVAIEVCPIAHPALVALLAPLRRLVPTLEAAKNGGEITATLLDDGPEIVLKLAAEPGLDDRQRLAAFADEQALVRLAIAVAGTPPAPLAARRQPLLTIAGIPIALPPAAFIQATAEGEARLQAFVCRHIAVPGTIVDLFAGVGTLSLKLAEAGATVRAFDAAAELVEACRHQRITATRRDLFANPLDSAELNRASAAILDPPRAGAAAQADALAASAVPRIVYASCDPASFARDAATLAAGGYRLAALEAIDQFVFAADVELVGCFLRG